MKVTVRHWKLKKGLSLYLDIYHQGRRWTENLHIILDGNPRFDDEKRRMADLCRAKREVELLADIHGVVAEHRGEIGFVAYALESGSPAIERSKKHLEDWFGLVQIRAVTKTMVEGYQDYLQDPEVDLASSTVETYMNALVAQFNRAVRERVIRESPCIGIKRVRADESAIKSLSVEEVERLKKTKILGEDAKTNSTGLGPEIKRAFLFACRTGLRWSDARRLTFGKIRNRQVEMTQQKTGKPIYVPINDEAWELISPGDRIPPGNELVFPLLQTDTDPNSYYVGPWGTAAGIPFQMTFHASRHTFIRSLLDAGVDIATVQALAGHSKIETTARYARASDRQKVAALKALQSHTDGSKRRSTSRS